MSTLAHPMLLFVPDNCESTHCICRHCKEGISKLRLAGKDGECVYVLWRSTPNISGKERLKTWLTLISPNLLAP